MLTRSFQTLRTERDMARASADALVREGASAASARALAERKLETTKQLFDSLHHHHSTCTGTCPGSLPGAMASTFEEGLQLQTERLAFGQEIKLLKDDRNRLQKELTDKTKESEAKEQEAATLKRRTDELAHALHDLRGKHDHVLKDAADIRNNLDSAYADLTRKNQEQHTLRKLKDDADAARYGYELQLKDAIEHYQQSQHRVEQLESQKSAIEALERHNATLQADSDVMQDRLNDHDRTVLVKDARISYLETQLQKALEAAARAQDEQNKAEAAVDPTTAEPPSAPALVQSLGAELEDIGEFPDSEAASQFEQTIELVNAFTAAQTAPVDVPTTNFSPQAAASFAQTDVTTTGEIIPVEPAETLSQSDIHTLWSSRIEPALRNLSTSSQSNIDLSFIIETVQDVTGSSLSTTSTQTEPEEEKKEQLSLSFETVAHVAPVAALLVSSSTQTDAPKLMHVGTSTVFDHAPVVYAERDTQTDAADPVKQEERETQTDIAELAHSGTSMVPIAHEERDTQTDIAEPIVHEERNTQTDGPTLAHTGTSTVSIVHEERDTQTNIADPVVHEENQTQTDGPKLTHTGTSTALDQPPTVHEERNTQTDAPQLEQTGTSTILDQLPIFQGDQGTQTDFPVPPTVVHITKKRSFFSLSTALAIFFAVLSLLYYAELDSWKNSNNRAGVNRLYNSMGYQRRGRHLFGTIPVCYERGETWLGEALCQQWAYGIQKIEAQIGVKYPERW